MTEHRVETVRTFCRLCEVGCGLVATVEDGRLTRVRPDHNHPFTKGFACAKGLRGAEVHRDERRVRAPQRRGDAGLVEVTWPEALGAIAGEVNRLVAEYGPRSVGVYLGNPNAFNALGAVAGGSFAYALGSDRLFSAATQDCANKYAVSELLYGTSSLHPIPDLDRTELLLCIGTNPRVSGSSFLSVADPVSRLRSIRQRGGRVVFVNPLVVEPDIGDTLQLLPDSDVYLLAALLHEIHRTVGFRPGAMEGRAEGIDEVAAFVAPYSPEAVAEVVGLPAEVIRRLAGDFASANGASVHASTGLNMGRQGALAYWLVQMLVLLTGNLDRSGGNFAAARALGAPPAPVDRTLASFESSPWGSYRRAVGMVPAVLLPELIEADDEPLRALFVVAGNPALSIGGGDRLRKALGSLELLVTVDLYENATSDLAHFVLPATDQFERADLNFFVQGVQGEPYVQWTPPVVAPDGNQWEEWHIFGGIQAAMGRAPLLDPTLPDPLALLYDGGLASVGLSMAAVRDAGGVVALAEQGPGGSLERAGISGALVCVPEALRPSLARAHELFEVLAKEQRHGRMRLITRRQRDCLNSWLLPPAERQLGRDRAPNPLWLNPADGERLGLPEGAAATVRNEHGCIEAEVRHDARLREGVVAMTHGFGRGLVAGRGGAGGAGGAGGGGGGGGDDGDGGVNVNQLAPSGPGSFDPVSCMAHLTGIPVEVAALR